MDYSLAKKLKEAGFPQGGKGKFEDGEDCDVCGHHVVYFPTLSELINSFGDKFCIRLQSYWNENNLEWQADIRGNFSSEPLDVTKEVGLGLTPEIAVANLWLALNGK